MGFAASTSSKCIPFSIILMTVSRMSTSISNTSMIPSRSVKPFAFTQNDLGVRSRQNDASLQGFDHPRDRAAVVDVDDGIHVVPEHGSGVEDVGVDEIDEAVTVRVRARDEKNPHFLSVHMEGDGIGERKDRASGYRGWAKEDPSPTGRVAGSEHP